MIVFETSFGFWKAVNPAPAAAFFGLSSGGFSATAAVVLGGVPENFSILSAHKYVPPAMELVAALPDTRIEGFLAAGHAAIITGWKLFEPLARLVDFGLGEGAVLFRHVLKNAAIPIVTIIGLQMSGLIGGAIVVETIFAWPGIGKLAVEAVIARDFPIVQAVVLLTATIFVVVNLIVDLLYGFLDPRVRFTRT